LILARDNPTPYEPKASAIIGKIWDLIDDGKESLAILLVRELVQNQAEHEYKKIGNKALADIARRYAEKEYKCWTARIQNEPELCKLLAVLTGVKSEDEVYEKMLLCSRGRSSIG